MGKKNKLTKLEKYALSIEYRQVYIDGKPTHYWVNTLGQIINKTTNNMLKGSPDKGIYVQ